MSTETGNLIGVYDSLDTALRDVYEALKGGGFENTRDLALATYSEQLPEWGELLASGNILALLAIEQIEGMKGNNT